MDKKQLTERLKDFREGKIPWVELARYLQVAIEEQVPIDGNYISKSKLQYILRGYDSATELGIISDQRILSMNPYLITHLAFIKKNMKTGFKEFLEDALNKKYGYHDLEKIGREVQGLKWKAPHYLDPLRRRIINLTKDLKSAEDAEGVKEFLGQECNELTHALRCIFDEEFKRSFEQKKEITV